MDGQTIKGLDLIDQNTKFIVELDQLIKKGLIKHGGSLK